MLSVRRFIEKKKASRKKQGDLLLREAWNFYGANIGFVLGKEDFYGAHYYCAFDWMYCHGGHNFRYGRHEYNYSCGNHTIAHVCCGAGGRAYSFD